jgi:hypothetical protein
MSSSFLGSTEARSFFGGTFWDIGGKEGTLFFGGAVTVLVGSVFWGGCIFAGGSSGLTLGKKLGIGRTLGLVYVGAGYDG